jgi:ubiquinone biosynthesis protein COQ9
MMRKSLLNRRSIIFTKIQEFSSSFDSSQEDIKLKILSKSLENQPQYGWTNEAIVQSVKQLNLNPALHTVISRGPVEIVEYFIKLRNENVINQLNEYKKAHEMDEINQTELLKSSLFYHLDYLSPYKSTWPHALSLLASPTQIPQTISLTQQTVEDLCRAIGFETTRYDWYLERASLISLLGMMELYMIQDTSANSEDTRFLVL